jgi:hypothetical protein
MLEVRAGVSWPTGSNPGYYCFFGKSADMNPLKKHPYIFLSEGHSHFKDDLFGRFTDDAKRLRCMIAYADRGAFETRDWMGFFADLFEYLSSKGLNIDLYPAPNSDDVDYGIVLIREAFRGDLLQIPKTVPTIVLKQLRDLNMQTKDYHAFFAFNALRYLISGFNKFETPSPETFMVKRTAPPSPEAWT